MEYWANTIKYADKEEMELRRKHNIRCQDCVLEIKDLWVERAILTIVNKHDQLVLH